MSKLLSGRRAVVTGAGSGIGAATMAVFVDQGATVLGLDLKPQGEFPIVKCDVSDIESLGTVAEDAISRLGSVDILVNCAGTSRTEFVDELSWPAYEFVMRTNLHAPVFLMSHFGRHMAGRGYGRIVNVTSTHARATNPKHLSYTAAKAGLEGATRTFAIELGRRGVLVNAVAPGFVATGMNPVAKLDTDWFRTTFVESGQIPLARYADPSEVARHIAFLASDDNSYFTGQTAIVDGGLTITVPPTAV